MSSVKVENIIIENDQISTCLVILDNKQKYEVEYKANEYFVTQLTVILLLIHFIILLLIIEAWHIIRG